jgi:hypothetical protein
MTFASDDQTESALASPGALVATGAGGAELPIVGICELQRKGSHL